MPSERGLATAQTSLRRIDVQRIGFKTSIFVIRQRIAGFQKIAVKIPRAADGVITS
jgi:hypothetical protein